jgi:2-methylisocitrate lyase-like PEP mutase family enzyme
VVRAVAPKPVNVLAVDPSWMTLDALAELGVRRISSGSAFARVAWAALLRAASAVATTGDFASLAEAAPFAALNDLFAAR